MRNPVQDYSDELLLALRMCDVPSPRIAEALAEVHSHVADTGEDPHQAFGAPREYAKDVAAALGRNAPTPSWRLVLSWSTPAYGLGTGLGAWLVLDGLLARVAGDDGVFGLPPVVPLLLGATVLTVFCVALFRLEREEAPVLDPRSGCDMTPPLPRWVVPLMVAPFALLIALAVVMALALR